MKHTFSFTRAGGGRAPRSLCAGAVIGAVAVAALLSACNRDREVQGSSAERNSVMAPATGNATTTGSSQAPAGSPGEVSAATGGSTGTGGATTGTAPSASGPTPGAGPSGTPTTTGAGTAGSSTTDKAAASAAGGTAATSSGTSR